LHDTSLTARQGVAFVTQGTHVEESKEVTGPHSVMKSDYSDVVSQ
jgi:hypothetical protein